MNRAMVETRLIDYCGGAKKYDDQGDSGSNICGLSLKPKGRVLEGFGYKSSLMNWKPGILKMELRDKEQV